MSSASKVCSLCLRPTEECGIVAGNVMEVYVCASCADDVLVTIRQEEEARAAAAAAAAAPPVAFEEEVLDTLKKARQFIVDGLSLGHVKPWDFTDEEKKLLPALDTVIDKMREVMAA